MSRQKVIDLGFHRRLQHASGSLTDQFIKWASTVEVRTELQHLRVDFSRCR
jgi:hypothetical protein